MQCKNCDNNLRTDFSFCPACGAKVVRKRITLKNLFYDVVERYLNVDNTFLKTVFHMISKPQYVADGYISGVRRKYLNPISYIAIALFLSGISVLIMRKYAWDKIDFSVLAGQANGEGMRKTLEFTMDYNNLIYLLYVPVIAIGGIALFNKKNYNISEHIIIGLYILATFSLISSIIAIAWLIIHPENYFNSSYYVIAAMLFYSLYVYIKISPFDRSATIFRSLGYMLLFFFGFLGVGIVINILLLVFGVVEFQDFLPKKA
ncbi:MAG: DUF3667 domain-containing protein [Allomuricauda sp.]|nr:MAG: DUF3667 domain-containing protein [Allomuricauda sp.]